MPVCTNDHLLIAFALDFKVLLVAFHRSYKGNGRAQFQIILLLGRMKIVVQEIFEPKQTSCTHF